MRTSDGVRTRTFRPLFPRSNATLGPIRPVILVIGIGSTIVALLLWIASFQMLAADRQQVIESAARDNANRAIAYEQFVARTLDAARLAADHLAQRFGGVQPLAKGARPLPLEDPVAANPLFASVLIVDAAGNVRRATVHNLPPTNIAGLPEFRMLRRVAGHRDLAIGAPRLSPYLRRPLLSLVRPMHDADGRFAGAVIVRVPVERFTDFNRGAAMRALDMISLIRLDGITLARREGNHVSYGQDLRNKLVMLRQAADADGTYIGPSAIDGVPRIFSHRRLASYGIFVTTGVGLPDVLRVVQRRAARTHWVMSGITAALFLFAGLAIYGLLRRERAARDLAGTNERLREAQRIGGIGDWEFIPDSGVVILSDQLCRMYGRDPADDIISPESALAYLMPEHRERLSAAIDAALAERMPQSCDVVALLDKDLPSHRRVRIVPVLDGEGRVRSLIGTEQDIDAEKAHEQLRDEVAHLARVEAMNVMAATIAHELAQPLTAASNYLAAARFAGATNPALLGDLLGKARDQIALTHRIMQRARDLAANRQTEGQANLADVVEDAIALVRVSTPGCGVTFTATLDPDAPWIAADKVQTQQVLLNLLRNACQAVEGQRNAVVEVSSHLLDNGWVELAVTDNGPGIPEEAGDIFTPFVSGRKTGLGLGLSICRTIVESYGGHIRSAHAPAGGARISFTLPLYSVPERKRVRQPAE